jgi:hypothetical protein
MSRVPRFCLVFAVTALLALLMAPVAGARTVSSPPAQLSERGWLGAALHWAEDLVGLRSHGHRGPSVHRKDGSTSQPTGGSCIDPTGRPSPWCL